jgi:predicted RNase H-like HicB family nuclease
VFDFCELPEHPLGLVFKAIVRPAEEGGFCGEVPALPGCVSQGETQEELLEHLKEAAIGWLEVFFDSDAKNFFAYKAASRVNHAGVTVAP